MKIRVRKANIDPDFRTTFEQYGVAVMQQLLANKDHAFLHNRQYRSTDQCREILLPWLTEQYDRAERKETFNLLMEIAILVFVGAELVFAVLDFISRHH